MKSAAWKVYTWQWVIPRESPLLYTEITTRIDIAASTDNVESTLFGRHTLPLGK